MMAKTPRVRFVYEKDIAKKMDEVKKIVVSVIENDPAKDAGKDRNALCDDIYAFTNQRVQFNQQKLVDVFNAHPHFKMHFTDRGVNKVTDYDMRFPLNYKPMKSILEENLETIKLKTQLARNEAAGNDRQFI